MEDKIEIIATGEKWLGYGIRTTFATLKNLINSTNESLLMTVYILKYHSIIECIKNALDRGVFIDIFANKNDTSLSQEIKILQKNYSNLKVHLTDEILHSKVLISDSNRILIGSANLTRSGMYKNYELGVFIEDNKIAYDLERLIRRLHE